MSYEQTFFKSPEALAQHFEEQARYADTAQRNAKTQRDAALSLREAVTWRAAAELARTVRNT